MTEATGKLTGWRLRLWEWKLDIGHHAGIKHQTEGALLCFNTKCEDHTMFDDEHAVITISLNSFAYVPLTETIKFETIEVPKWIFISFLVEVCMMAVIMENEKAKIRTLSEFITAQSTDSVWRVSFAIAEKIHPFPRW